MMAHLDDIIMLAHLLLPRCVVVGKDPSSRTGLGQVVFVAVALAVAAAGRRRLLLLPLLVEVAVVVLCISIQNAEEQWPSKKCRCRCLGLGLARLLSVSTCLGRASGSDLGVRSEQKV